MLLRVALLVFGLLLAGSATADQKPFPLTQICPYQTALMRKLALRGVFDAPPAINTLMLNVIDGKMPQVRQQLSEMNKGDAVRWRQSALIIAAYAREPAMVAARWMMVPWSMLRARCLVSTSSFTISSWLK